MPTITPTISYNPAMTDIAPGASRHRKGALAAVIPAPFSENQRGVAFPLVGKRTGRTAMAAKFEISKDKAG
jgi:hypothetical protein